PSRRPRRSNSRCDNVEYMLTRRGFFAAASAAAWTARADSAPALRIGVMDGVLRLPSRPEAVAKARSLGLGGVQVTLGQDPSKTHLLLEDAALQRAWKEAARRSRVTL